MISAWIAERTVPAPDKPQRGSARTDGIAALAADYQAWRNDGLPVDPVAFARELEGLGYSINRRSVWRVVGLALKA